MRQTSDTIRVEGVISEKESLEYSRKLSASMRKLREVKSNKKAYDARANSDAKELENEISELTEIIDSRRALRDVGCTIEYDFIAGKKNWIAVDSGEVVRSTAIPEDERNEELPIEIANDIPEDEEEGMVA